MSTLIIQTKLMTPRLRANSVTRPQLLARLNAGANQAVTTVIAPAGFGKSTLIAAWLAQAERQVAWLSLDSAENNPQQFWSYVLAAVQSIVPSVGQTAHAMLTAQQPVPLTAVVGALCNELLAAPQFTLVLDDYHLIDNETVHETVTFLLDHAPPTLHVVLASRTTPPLPLARWRVNSTLTEITAAQLRFSAQESAEFLAQTMSLTLSDEQRQTIIGRTEGWAAGLQLAALSAEQGTQISGTQYAVWDYLLQEVFGRLDEATQTFLLQISMLDQLCADLCQAVTQRDDAQTQLRQLEAANIFLIALDGERRWYRFHHLFVEFLRQQARVSAVELHAGQQRAAAWYAGQGGVGQALTHSFAAGNEAWAANYLLQQADALWTMGNTSQLGGWLEALSAETRLATPRLELYRAWASFFEGKLNEMVPILKTVTNVVTERAEPAELGMFNAIYTAVYGAIGQAKHAIEHGNTALRWLAADDVIWRSVVGLSLGAAYMQVGQLPHAIDTYTTASKQAERAGNFSGALYGYGMAARLHMSGGQPESAEPLYQAALTLIERQQAASLPISGAVFAGYGELLQSMGTHGAEQFLVDGLRLCERGGFALASTYEALAQVREEQGNLAAAAALRQKAANVPPPPMAWDTSLSDEAMQLLQPEGASSSGTPSPNQAGLVEPLSDRELEILRLIADGLSNKAISAELIVAISTVKWHLNNIYGKLNVNSRTQAVAHARSIGLL